MDTRNEQANFSGERLSAMLLAVAATVIVFAAIDAAFTPHAGHVIGHVLGLSPLAL